jgi:transcriptional regulator with XRE-family HTH domain
MNVSKYTVRTMFFVCIALMSACKSGDKKSKNNIGLDTVDYLANKQYINPNDTTGEGLPIFYNMYLSVEMSTLFSSAGAVFQKNLMNSMERIPQYVTSDKKALNLGIYAVDLSYARVFDQLDIAGRYLNSMQKLAEELGIPGDYFSNTAHRLERNIDDKDSLIKIANEVYTTTDDYLKDNEQYTTAALIILGGWIEAMYIANDIIKESEDQDIIERFAEQKYSLMHLRDMLGVYRENNQVVGKYLVQLEELQKVFDKFSPEFEVDFNPNSKEGKKILADYLTQVEIIGNRINKIRTEIVS